MFDDRQKQELAKPLDRATVKSRKQGGRDVSYIEGWHAIAEANRIFGFDGWSRESVEIKCVAEKPRDIGQAKNAGWGVTYVCKVRIVAGHITREGCGSGHGIDRDLGQAHESAIKEAETDAMKRALMTFGNPFGLALYDKLQENVADVPKRVRKETDTPPEWRNAWENLGAAKQAGILCDDRAFWKFLSTKGAPIANADQAADYVRITCKVASRAELAKNEAAAKLWRALVADYRAWQREPAVVESPGNHHERPADQGAPVNDHAPHVPAGAPEVAMSLEDEAREAAKRGEGTFRAFYKRISAADRDRLEPLGAELRKMMDEADA